MEQLLLVFLCLLPLAWPKSYLIKTEDTTETPRNDKIVEEDGSDYTDDNDEVEESKPTKTTCEEFSKSLTKICMKIEDGTIKENVNDYIGGLEAPWRRDILQMEKILEFHKLFKTEDYRLVSARVGKSSRISEFTKICISCNIMQPPIPVVEESGTNYSDDEHNMPGQEKTVCEQFPEILPKVCKNLQGDETKTKGDDYFGGLDSGRHTKKKDKEHFNSILRWKKWLEENSPANDLRLVSARVDKSSRISQMTKICKSCGQLPSANPADVPSTENGTDYGEDEDHYKNGKAGCSDPPSTMGKCRAARTKWTFHKAGGCKKFLYGGCGKTKNFYGSMAKCKMACGNGA